VYYRASGTSGFVIRTEWTERTPPKIVRLRSLDHDAIVPGLGLQCAAFLVILRSIARSESDIRPASRTINSLRHRVLTTERGGTTGLLFWHRRLSIIDSTPAAADGVERWAFSGHVNGEIYNYLELPRSCARTATGFRPNPIPKCSCTGTDTGEPTCRRSSKACSPSDCHRLRRQLFLGVTDSARTAFVRRPEERRHLRPEMRLCSTDLRGTRARYSALRAYLCLNYVSGERPCKSHSAGVPGQLAVVRHSRTRRRHPRYWTFPAREYTFRSQDPRAEQLEHLLDQSVRIALRSDVPVWRLHFERNRLFADRDECGSVLGVFACLLFGHGRSKSAAGFQNDP